MIDLRQPIRSLGDYQVNIKLLRGVSVPISVRVADPTQLAEEKAAAAAAAAAPPAPAEAPAEETAAEEAAAAAS